MRTRQQRVSRRRVRRHALLGVLVALALLAFGDEGRSRGRKETRGGTPRVSEIRRGDYAIAAPAA